MHGCVVVACAGIATKLVKVWQLFSFPTRYKVLHTCRPLHCSNCDTCILARVLKLKNLGWKGGDFLNCTAAPLVTPLPPPIGAGLLLQLVVLTETVGLLPPWASHKASAALNIAAAALWFPGPTSSCMEGGSQMRNIARNRSLSGLTPCGRDCLSLPMRMLGLRPCMSNGRQAAQSKTATCFCQTATAEQFWGHQMVYPIHCMQKPCPECPEGLAWAGWQEHWRI